MLPELIKVVLWQPQWFHNHTIRVLHLDITTWFLWYRTQKEIVTPQDLQSNGMLSKFGIGYHFQGRHRIWSQSLFNARVKRGSRSKINAKSVESARHSTLFWRWTQLETSHTIADLVTHIEFVLWAWKLIWFW